jgi:hypothetical protein
MSSGKLERPRRRMDRRDLKRAARTIERLARSGIELARKAKPVDELPAGHRQTMHLGLDVPDLRNLDKIVTLMRNDPILGRLKDMGREKAARFAIAYFAEHAPARLTAKGWG